MQDASQRILPQNLLQSPKPHRVHAKSPITIVRANSRCSQPYKRQEFTSTTVTNPHWPSLNLTPGTDQPHNPKTWDYHSAPRHSSVPAVARQNTLLFRRTTLQVPPPHATSHADTRSTPIVLTVRLNSAHVVTQGCQLIRSKEKFVPSSFITGTA